jgi:hypothetical protein
MPKNQTRPELLTQDVVIAGGSVESPEKLNRIAKVIERTLSFVDVQLREDFGPFKMNTIFHCKVQG